MGREVFVGVPRADMPKNTNVTVELVAVALTRLKASGTDLSAARLHLQLDNTSSCNKNVQLFRWCSYLVACNIVKEVDVCFLRTGHTHENTTQSK